MAEVLKPQLHSSNILRLYTRLIVLLLIHSHALSCLLQCKVISLMTVLKSKNIYHRLFESSMNVNIIISLMLFLYFVSIYTCRVCCCIFVYLFTIISNAAVRCYIKQYDNLKRGSVTPLFNAILKRCKSKPQVSRF